MKKLFVHREDVMASHSKDKVLAAAEKLAAAGIANRWWRQEPMPVGGCGAKMRPSDWQKGLKAVDNDEKRMIYHLEVAVEDLAHAREVLQG